MPFMADALELRIDGRVAFRGWAVPQAIYIDYDVLVHDILKAQITYCLYTGATDRTKISSQPAGRAWRHRRLHAA